jgi:hypothetical protein
MVVEVSHVPAVAGVEVVDRDDLGAGLEEPIAEVGTEEASSSGHEASGRHDTVS